jgi:hypothetical protein
MKIHSAVIIGAGGIGSQVLEPLYRLLAYHPDGTKKVFLVDGDKYEDKNSSRQLVPPKGVGQNKAVALAEFHKHLDGLVALPYYVDESRMATLLYNIVKKDSSKRVLIITAVDRDRSRHVAYQAAKRVLKNFVFITPGNEYETSASAISIHEDGVELVGDLLERYPNLKDPEDEIPTNCLTEAVSSPQLITANASAALDVLLYTQAVLDGEPVPAERRSHIRRFLNFPIGSLVPTVCPPNPNNADSKPS